MRLIVCFLMLLGVTRLVAQSPGGVTGVVSWHRPGLDESKKSASVNNNSVQSFDASQKATYVWPEKMMASGVSFFCVSVTDTLNERVLWSIGRDSATNVILTNRRMAGLDDFKYINFQSKPSVSPQILTYSRKSELGDTLTHKTWVQVGSIGTEKIPASDFKGLLPEYVVYNRVLSFQDRNRVESYLALKYGISLNQTYPTSYLNSKGKVIWDANKYGSFSGSIAGVGRDDLSGLVQLKSCSSEAPQMLEIAAANLEDQDFLIWGDNGATLKLNRKRGEVPRLYRGWIAASSGKMNERETTVKFDARCFQELHPLVDNEIFWLAIDDSGKGNFEIGQSRYIANSSKSVNCLQFDSVKWDVNNNGDDFFSLIAAPELFAALNTTPPTCRTNTMGAVTVELVGGVAPFQVQLLQDGVMVARQKDDVRIYGFDNLKQGAYCLLINDSQNKTYRKEFLLDYADMEQLADFEPLSLKSGSSLMLDGSKGLESTLDYSFEWQKPDGERVGSNFLEVDKPGVYVLTVCNSDGCSTMREAEVQAMGADFLKYVELTPNPAKQRTTTLRVQLVDQGDITVWVTSPTGQIVSSEKCSGNSFYSITCRFPKMGLWLVTVEGNGVRKTLKVLAENN